MLFNSLKDIAITCNRQKECVIGIMKDLVSNVVNEIYEYLQIRGLTKEKLQMLQKNFD